ncbi:hypothetical protein ACH4UM_21080 [Streptomyces sp. NPDC020801]|uniref:hypothetical protein n=1 Tax=unclassified Streptomyces TaxID=2593676 RepID=UPI003787E76F
MIQQVVHERSGTVDATLPAGVAPPLAVAGELHSPANGPADRPRDVDTAPQLMGLRTSAERPHRHRVPLKRLTAMAT